MSSAHCRLTTSIRLSDCVPGFPDGAVPYHLQSLARQRASSTIHAPAPLYTKGYRETSMKNQSGELKQNPKDKMTGQMKACGTVWFGLGRAASFLILLALMPV